MLREGARAPAAVVGDERAFSLDPNKAANTFVLLVTAYGGPAPYLKGTVPLVGWRIPVRICESPLISVLCVA